MRDPWLVKLGMIGGGVHFTIVSVTQLFFALYAVELGASTMLIGVMVMLRALLPLVFSLPSGGLIDRIGAVRVLKMGCVGTIAALALMVWGSGLLMLGLSQILIGLTTLLTASSMQVIVSQGDKVDRDRRIGTYSAWSSGGNMVGPLAGGAIATGINALPIFEAMAPVRGYQAAFLACLILLVLYYGAVMAIHANPHVPAEGKTKPSFSGLRESRMLIRNSSVQYGLIGTFLIHFMMTIWTTFFPLYLEQLGYAALTISLLVSLRGAAALGSRLLLPRLMRIATQERVLISAGCVSALCLIVLPLLDALPVAIVVMATTLGFATGVNMPVSTIIMVDGTETGDRGKVMGLRLLTNRLSQVLAPALFGVMGGAVGLGTAFISGGTLLLLTLLGFGVYSSRRNIGPNR